LKIERGGLKMTQSATITNTLNATIQSLKAVIPLNLNIGQPSMLTAPLPSEMGVLVGVTGQMRGRLVIEGPQTTFSAIGATMFGMTLEGEMLQSFAGELGNMIAGNVSTNLYQVGITIDITPPTVLVGDTKIYGFDKAFRLPFQIDGAGEACIVLMIEE
jgi:chemotaxis protein CheX